MKIHHLSAADTFANLNSAVIALENPKKWISRKSMVSSD